MMMDEVLLSSLVRCQWWWWCDVPRGQKVVNCNKYTIIMSWVLDLGPDLSPHSETVCHSEMEGCRAKSLRLSFSARHRLMLGRRLWSLYRGRVGTGRPPLHHSWSRPSPEQHRRTRRRDTTRLQWSDTLTVQTTYRPAIIQSESRPQLSGI